MAFHMRNWRSVLLVVLLGLTCNLVSADPKSKQLLDGMTARLASYKSYEISFAFAMQGTAQTSGTVVVSGNCYRVKMPDLEVYCDGKICQTYIPSNKEVTIESLDPNGNNLVAYFVRFLRMYDQDFNHIYRGTQLVNGKQLEVVKLTPKSPDSDFSSIQLELDPTTKLPVKASFIIRNESDTVGISIRNLKPNVPVSSSMFTFDRSKHPGVEVIDFR